MRSASFVWTLVVLLAFFWSFILFWSRVFGERRKQETGLLYSVAGLIIYIFAFGDRLRIESIRRLIDWVPGTSHLSYKSSIVPLIALSIVYVFRVIVYFELVPTPSSREDAEWRRIGNDIVAPILALITLALCLATLTSGLYGINIGLTMLVVVAAFYALYYYRVGYRLRRGMLLLMELVRRLIRNLPDTLIAPLVALDARRSKLPRVDQAAHGADLLVPSRTKEAVDRWQSKHGSFRVESEAGANDH